MAEKLKDKSFKIIIAVAVAIVALIIIFAVFKVVKSNNAWKNATKAEDVVIKDKDSNEVKAEKIQKKIELINKDIEEIQLRLNPELEKLNGLYEEYVSVMNEFQTGTETVEEPTEEPAEESTEQITPEETSEETPEGEE